MPINLDQKPPLPSPQHHSVRHLSKPLDNHTRKATRSTYDMSSLQKQNKMAKKKEKQSIT